MRIKMRDTTRHQQYHQLMAGQVYEVDDATGEHLLGQRIAQKTTAPVTADQEAEDAALDAAEQGRGGMVTRADAAALTGDQGPAEEPTALPRRGNRS